MIEIFIAASAVHAPNRKGVFRPSVKGNSRTVMKFGERLIPVESKKSRANERRLVAGLRRFLETMAADARELGSPLALPLTGPVRADVTFVVPIPKDFPAWKRRAAIAGRFYPVTRPDRGNYLKLLEDALEKAGWLRDDAIVVSGDVSKAYGEIPGYKVALTEIAQATADSERLPRCARASCRKLADDLTSHYCSVECQERDEATPEAFK